MKKQAQSQPAKKDTTHKKAGQRGSAPQPMEKRQLQPDRPSNKPSKLTALIGKVIEVTVEKLVVGGHGLARAVFPEIDAEKSLVMFVPNTAPGDVGQIKIVEAEKNHLIGELVSLVKPSAQRIEPACRVASECGGCTWQHVLYDEQVRQKELILTELLKKQLPNVEFSLLPTVRGQKQLAYRNRIQVKHQDGQVGYFKKRTHEIVSIESCPIAEPEVSSEISKIPQLIENQKHKKPGLTKWEIRRTTDEKIQIYEIGQRGEGLSFSQVNSEINTKLIDRVVDLVKSHGPTEILELYAGGGNFTFPLADNLPNSNIKAVELNSELTKFAVEKIKQTKLQKRISFFTNDCASFSRFHAFSEDFVLLDPPREGCDPLVIQRLAHAAPRQILYISCHPVNFVRDLKVLLSLQPTYKIVELQIFDMFPQTDHFETLCLLSR